MEMEHFLFDEPDAVLDTHHLHERSICAIFHADFAFGCSFSRLASTTQDGPENITKLARPMCIICDTILQLQKPGPAPFNQLSCKFAFGRSFQDWSAPPPQDRFEM